jgi:hypothetical protein
MRRYRVFKADIEKSVADYLLWLAAFDKKEINKGEKK